MNEKPTKEGAEGSEICGIDQKINTTKLMASQSKWRSEGSNMRMKKPVVWVLTLSLLVGALNAFSFSGTAQGSQDTVYIAMQQDMPNYNNFDLASNTIWKDYVLGRFTFESLSALDPAGNIYPLLAEHWDFWPVNLTVIIHLRQGVKFQDHATSGQTVDADDVLFSYFALRDGTTFSGPIIGSFDADGDGVAQKDEVDGTIDHDGDGSFEGITKINNSVVKMVMGKTYAQFFLTTLGIPIIPEHVWNLHVDPNGRMDTLWSNEDATIGTGPFYYTEGLQDIYRVLTRFDDYWGIDEITPSGHRLFPAYVREIYYRMYPSIDSAVQALRCGQVDHFPRSIPHDYVPDLTSNPYTDLRFVSDNGYFYLAFNQKREPMNHLAFRKAVSYIIDKETIVNSYLGGYGRAGDSVEPPFWADWYNDSVEWYPFDIMSAANALTAGGFTGVGTSLRMPDGRPVPPLVIMTPPEDYDPVRIKAGELIAKNLRSLGMDVIAKPLDFDQLVGKMNAFDYDMLIIGWSLTSDPIGNVFDILGPLASQNFFGFWSTTNENPFYNTLGGVSTLADAQTQYLADLTHDYGVLAKNTFDRWEQIRWTKAGQGVISQAVPVNVLYYLVNIYVVSTWWESDTWINFLGELLNVYTMGELTPAGAPPSVGFPITAALYASDGILVDQDEKGSVMVLGDQGMLLPGADVTLTAPASVTLTPASGISNASGIFEFTFSSSQEGYFSLSATASLGIYDFTDSKIIQAAKSVPDILHLTVTPGSTFLRITESTPLSLRVEDGLGNPVEGATVTLDEGLMGHGSVDSLSVTTDLLGDATITYTAPPDFSQAVNRHLKVTLSLSPSKAGYYLSNTNTAIQIITIYNPSPSDWHFVLVQSATDFGMDSAGNTSTVTVLAHDAAGAPLIGEMISIDYTNIQNLFNPVTQVVTAIAGQASFDVVFKNGIDTTATRISLKSEQVLNSVGCAVTLLFKGVTVPTTPIYGGYLRFNTTPLLDPTGAGTLDAAVFLYDIDGNVPLGDITTTIVVGEPDLGTSAWLYSTDPWLYNNLWDYAGIQSFTSWDASNIISGGYFLSDLMTDAEIDVLNGGLYSTWSELQNDWWTFVDYTNMKGVTISNGVGYFTVAAADLLLQDSVPHVLVVPNGKMGFYVAPDFTNYYWVLQGQTTVSTEFATMRGMSIISPLMSVDRPVMKSSGTNSTSNVDVALYDQDNSPVVSAGVNVYVQQYGERPFFNVDLTPDTDATGSTSTTVRARTQDTTGNPLHNPKKQLLYASPNEPGYASVLASTEIFDIPLQLFMELDHQKRLETNSPSTIVTVTVTDEYGTQMQGLDVVFTSNNGTLTPELATTDVLGEASVQFDFLVTGGFQIATLSACTSKEGYSAACATSKVEGYNITNISNTPSTIIVTSVPLTGYVSDDGSIAVAADISDPEGVDEVKLILDGTPPINVPMSNGSISHVFSGLDNGTHSIEILVKDGVGNLTSEWIFFEVDIQIFPPTGSILINAGDEYTASTSVTLTLTYTGGSFPVDYVRYSNDGTWDTETWEPPSPTKVWDLTGGDGSKTVYYQISANGTLSQTYQDDIALDMTAPTGSITINDGDESTTSSSVTLSLTYSDASSGVDQVRYSSDGVWDTENWELPSSTRTWTLTSDEGVKTVYYQVMDNAGLISQTYTDDIVYDSTPPTVVSVTPFDGSKNVEVTVVISVRFSEEMDRTTTQNSFSLMLDNTHVEGSTHWSPDGEMVTFTPTDNLKEGKTYRIVVETGAEDLVGNNLAAPGVFSFETEKAEDTSFLAQNWWIIPCVIVIVLVVALLIWRMRNKPEPQEDDSTDEPAVSGMIEDGIAPQSTDDAGKPQES